MKQNDKTEDILFRINCDQTLFDYWERKCKLLGDYDLAALLDDTYSHDICDATDYDKLAQTVRSLYD